MPAPSRLAGGQRAEMTAQPTMRLVEVLTQAYDIRRPAPVGKSTAVAPPVTRGHEYPSLSLSFWSFLIDTLNY